MWSASSTATAIRPPPEARPRRRGLWGIGLLALLAAVYCPVAVWADGNAPAPYRVIVNAGNPATTVERRYLADVFLKKVSRWPSDELIRPVDLSASSSLRRRFSDEVLKRSVAAVKSYWQQQVFSGRGVPPPELDSEEQVVRYVLDHSGAVGYVSGTAHIEGAKVLNVR